MSSLLIEQAPRLRLDIQLPGDKSIAHRSIIISAITPGRTVIKNFPFNEDCFYTLSALKKLGIKISCSQGIITVFGKGLYGFRKPRSPIFSGDSGTTLRLLLGVLSGQDFQAILKAGSSLSRRPMLRVTAPLRLMGAQIKSQVRRRKSQVEEYPPITIKGGSLKAITFRVPVASSQVKSAILLAALYAKGKTKITEPLKTRDHTERMLKLFKADIRAKQNIVTIKGKKELVSPGVITMPGDISSASFFIVLAAILPDAQIIVRNVGLNPSRIGIIKALKRMGADIKIRNQKSEIRNGEPMGDVTVKSSVLKGVLIKKEEIPSLIDELPVLMVAASCAKGKSVFEAVEELRVKETDRIRSISDNLRKMGVDIKILKTANSEKIIIKGTAALTGAAVKSFGDHRTAMSMIVAGLNAKGRTFIDDISCINKSFPGFLKILKQIIR